MLEQASPKGRAGTKYLCKLLGQKILFFIDICSVNTGPFVQALKQINGVVHVHWAYNLLEIFVREASVIVQIVQGIHGSLEFLSACFSHFHKKAHTYQLYRQMRRC